MEIDAQEYINELKTFNRYVNKRRRAYEKYNDIELSLKRLNEYVSPSAINTVEITKFRNGKLVSETIPVPKLDPDPGRKERIRKELIMQQCELEDEISFYSAKIDRVVKISNTLPEKLRRQCWDVYVKHRAGRVSRELNTTKERVYKVLRDRLESEFSVVS